MGFNIGRALKGAIKGGIGGATSGGGLWGAIAGAGAGALGGGFSSKKSSSGTAQGLGALAGGIMGSINSGNSAKEAYRYWQRQFGAQTDFEKWKMMNAHQIEAQDLAKAGINPVLTGGGQGAMNATSPGGGLSDAIAGNTAQTNMINSALRAQQLYNDNKKIQSEIRNIDEDTTTKTLNNNIIKKYGSKQKNEEIANIIQNTAMLKANSALQNEKINSEIQDQWLKRAQMTKTQNESAIVANQIPKSAKEAQFYRNDPFYLATIATAGRELAPTVNSLTGAAAMINGAKKFGSLAEQIQNKFEKETGTIKKTEYFDKRGVFKGAKYQSRIYK